MKLFIICGNHQEYQEFVNKKLSSLTESFRITDFVYVSSPKAFVGHSNPHGWFIGTWRERQDMSQIFSILLTMQLKNPGISRAFLEYQIYLKEKNASV